MLPQRSSGTRGSCGLHSSDGLSHLLCWFTAPPQLYEIIKRMGGGGRNCLFSTLKQISSRRSLLFSGSQSDHRRHGSHLFLMFFGPAFSNQSARLSCWRVWLSVFIFLLCVIHAFKASPCARLAPSLLRGLGHCFYLFLFSLCAEEHHVWFNIIFQSLKAVGQGLRLSYFSPANTKEKGENNNPGG